MGIQNSVSAAAIVEERSGKINFENWNIEKILEYISGGDGEEKEVICHAKIMDISSRKGWKYLSCGTCSKMLERSATSLICNTCNKSTGIGIPRFRVELLVGDGCKTSTFVLFDRDARKLTNTSVEDINVSEGNECTDIPKCLLELVGKTLNFQVKISEYNFQTSSQTFTVTRVIEEGDGHEIKKEDGEKCPTFETTRDDTRLPEEDEDEEKEEEKDLIPEESEREAKKLRVV
uniref:Replication factor A C-terminal domain-containing protein n=1 Tax=Noccaea caerulescens TaxID=107243 RepID=A0A1J3E0B5_NOCCA